MLQGVQIPERRRRLEVLRRQPDDQKVQGAATAQDPPTGIREGDDAGEAVQHG